MRRKNSRRILNGAFCELRSKKMRPRFTAAYFMSNFYAPSKFRGAFWMAHFAIKGAFFIGDGVFFFELFEFRKSRRRKKPSTFSKLRGALCCQFRIGVPILDFQNSGLDEFLPKFGHFWSKNAYFGHFSLLCFHKL